MLTRRQFISTLALASLGGCRAVTEAVRPAPYCARSCCWVDGLCPTRIAIVGDVQRTGLLEMSLLGRAQNDREREAVLAAIAGERPDMLLMLGDQVVLGDDPAGWEYFDRIMDPIHAAEIPVRAMLGNHDYEGRDGALCMENFCDRFPHQRHRKHGLLGLGGLALVTVDSNFDRLDPSEARAQAGEYAEILRHLDSDPDVRAVIVASHHPPYTNSDLSAGADLELVRDMFADPFRAAKKTRLYLSGHVHSYERFIDEEKSFVVCGGGGGPRREVDISAGRPYLNDAYRKDRLRPFHYMMLTLHDDKITLETKMLRMPRRGEAAFYVGDRFALSFGES